jgi:hypothetical protein
MFVRLRYMFCLGQMWENLQPRKGPIKISKFIVLCVEKINIGIFQQNLSTHPNLVKVEQGLTSRVFLRAAHSKIICMLVRMIGNSSRICA